MSTFYHWKVEDGKHFRKLILHPIENNLTTELDKFVAWSGEFQECTKCNNSLPTCDYFFKNRGNRGLDKICKKCQGSVYRWGDFAKQKFLVNNQKYCQKCDTVFPANEIYFNRHKNGQSGFSSYCKKCVSGCEYGINRYVDEIVDAQEGCKICRSCYVELPITDTYFFKSSHISDGYEATCKECQGVKYGVQYLNKVNRDSLEKDHKYCTVCKNIKHYDDFQFNKKNSDKRSHMCRQCENIIGHQRRHNDGQQKYSIDDWLFALNFWTGENGNVCCAYCGSETSKPTKEHMYPFSKGGLLSRENIIPVCKSCNSSKKNMDLLEYHFSPKSKINRQRWDKILDYLKLTGVLVHGEISIEPIYINGVQTDQFLVSMA